MILTVPSWLEITEMVSSVLLNAAMVAVAVASACYAYKAYKHQKDRSKKDAACELAGYYADVILKEYRLIHDVFNKTGFDAFVRDVINIDCIAKFDIAELTKFTSDKQMGKDVFMDRIRTIEPLTILKCKVDNANSFSEREKAQAYYTAFKEMDEEERAKEAYYILNDFMQKIIDLMNHLEWFCMKCSYGLAEEELIYRSLHQTFLSIVWQLYPFISSRNENIEEKFFTNVIWLFGQWQQRVVDIKKIAEQKKKEYDKQLENLCNSTPLK